MRYRTSGATILPSINEPIIEFSQGCNVPSSWTEIGWKPKRRAEDDGGRKHKRRLLDEDIQQDQNDVATQHTKKPLRSEPPRFDYSDIFHAFEEDLKSLKDTGVRHDKRTKMLDGSMEFELISLYKDWVEETAQSEELEGDGGDADFFNNLLADLRIEEDAVVNDMCEPQIPDLVRFLSGCAEGDEVNYLSTLLVDTHFNFPAMGPSHTLCRRLCLFKSSTKEVLVVLAPISDIGILSLKAHWLIDQILNTDSKSELKKHREELKMVYGAAEAMRDAQHRVKIDVISFKAGCPREYHAGRGEQSRHGKSMSGAGANRKESVMDSVLEILDGTGVIFTGETTKQALDDCFTTNILYCEVRSSE